MRKQVEYPFKQNRLQEFLRPFHMNPNESFQSIVA